MRTLHSDIHIHNINIDTLCIIHGAFFRFISPKIRRVVKSHRQHAYLQKQLNLLETNSMQTLHFRLKFYAANIIFPCI